MTTQTDHNLLEGMLATFPKLRTSGLYAVQYHDEYNLYFHIADVRFPRLLYARYGDRERLSPYYPLTYEGFVNWDDVERIIDAFLDPNYDTMHTNRVCGYHIVYTDSGKEFTIKIRHPQCWSIDVHPERN